MSKHRYYAIGCLSNVFECYEFSVYSYLAGIIATQFFAPGNVQANLIKVFLIFAISYLVKPLGSFFWGYLGDYHGKAAVMRWSIVIMAIPTFFIGLLPNYQHIGHLSMVLLLLLRLVQGFAVGGELPGSACYMFEAAGEKSKRFFCSLVSASSMLGMLCGALVVTILQLILNDQQMHAWGWRLPFFLGLPLAFIIYYVRRSMNEQVKQNTLPKSKYLKTLFTKHWQAMLTVISLNTFVTASFYLLFMWMPVYLIYYLHVAQNTAHVSSSLGLFFLIIFTFIVGRFSTEISRRVMLIIGLLLVTLSSYPLLKLMATSQGMSIYFIQIALAFGLSLIKGVVMEAMTSRFDHAIRCIGLSLSFTFSMAIFGSLAPVLAGYWINSSGNLLAPAFIISIACFFALPFTVKLVKQS